MIAAGQVMHAIATRLNGIPSGLCGTRNYTDRAWPLAEKDLPARKVVSPDEDIEPMTVHTPTPQEHKLQVEVKGYVQDTAEIDDAMHALASEALIALFNPPAAPDALSAIAGKVQLSLRRIERVMKTEGQADLGLIQITLRAQFKTRSNAPDTLI